MQASVSRDTDQSIDEAATMMARPEVDYKDIVQLADIESVDGSSIIIDWDQVDQITADVNL